MDKLKICKGDGRLFDVEHRHYAKGFCFREYRKIRYKERSQLKGRYVFCAGADHKGPNMFGPNLRHYAKGLCRNCYNKIRYKMGKSNSRI